MHVLFLRILTQALLAVALLFPGSLLAASLLLGFEYGTPKSAIASREGVTMGKEDFQDHAFLKGVQWAGYAWTAQCHFSDAGLNGVTLYSSYSRELLTQISDYLKAQKFQMLGMIIDDKALDMISLVKLGGIKAFQKRFRELTSAHVPQRISYAWYDVTKIPQEQLRDAASLGQLLMLVPKDTLQVDVTQSANGKELTDRMLTVHFSYPIMDELRKHPNP